MKLVALVVMLASVSAARASAPNCAPSIDDLVGEAPPRRLPPWVTTTEGVRIERTTIHLDCSDRQWPRCGFDAELVIANDSQAEISSPIQIASVSSLQLTEQPPIAVLAAAGHATVRVHGRFDVSVEAIRRPFIQSGCPGFVEEPPIYERHLLSASRGQRASARLALPVTEALVVTVDHAHGWPLHVGAASGGELVIDERRAPSLLRVGGPFVAAGGGGAFAADEMTFRMRAGYEVARPGWLVYSVAAETDFDEVTIVPAVEAAISTSWMQVHAVGVGVPVRIGPDPAVGIRGQVALGLLPAITAVMTIDRIGGATQMGVYGQLSL